MLNRHPVWSFDSLLDYFLQHREVVETDLLKHCFAGEAVFESGLSLDLFEKHFLLYRRLYLFADELLTTPYRLSIVHIRIKLLDEAEARAAGLWEVPEGTDTDVAENSLRGYYLDQKNLETMTTEGLNQLVDSALAKIFGCPTAADQQRAATILGVAIEAPPAELRRRFRELCHRHHPDHSGGEAETFHELRWAYGILSGLSLD